MALRHEHTAALRGSLLHAQAAGCRRGLRMDRLKASLSRKSAETLGDKVRQDPSMAGYVSPHMIVIGASGVSVPIGARSIFACGQ